MIWIVDGLGDKRLVRLAMQISREQLVEWNLVMRALVGQRFRGLGAQRVRDALVGAGLGYLVPQLLDPPLESVPDRPGETAGEGDDFGIEQWERP